MEIFSFMPRIRNRMWADGIAIRIRPLKECFFSPCSSKMLCFLFWLNGRLPSEEDVKIAVIEKKSQKESFCCRKPTPRVWEAGETGV